MNTRKQNVGNITSSVQFKAVMTNDNYLLHVVIYSYCWWKKGFLVAISRTAKLSEPFGKIGQILPHEFPQCLQKTVSSWLYPVFGFKGCSFLSSTRTSRLLHLTFRCSLFLRPSSALHFPSFPACRLHRRLCSPSSSVTHRPAGDAPRPKLFTFSVQ